MWNIRPSVGVHPINPWLDRSQYEAFDWIKEKYPWGTVHDQAMKLGKGSIVAQVWLLTVPYPMFHVEHMNGLSQHRIYP